MKEQLRNLSLHRLGKAKDDLESAQALLDLGKFAQSMNRSYYAMFHATRAVLAFDRFDSKKHSGVISFFIVNYVKTGKINDTFSKMLTGAEKVRLNCDYNDFFVADRETAELQVVNATSYLCMIEILLEEKKQAINEMKGNDTRD